MANKTIKPVVKECIEAGCLLIEKRREGFLGKTTGSLCRGWSDPGYMWKKYGKCPHLTTDPEEIIKREEERKNYTAYVVGEKESKGRYKK